MIVYTDGACSGNPGPGGLALVFVEKDKPVGYYSEGYILTTNNRMEIMAVLFAMLAAEEAGEPLTVYTDSKYVVNSFKYWIGGWAKNNWHKKDGEEVKNKDLWMLGYDLLHRVRMSINHVKGHNGNRFNEMANHYAQLAAADPSMIDHGFMITFDPTWEVDDVENEKVFAKKIVCVSDGTLR